MPIKGAAVTVCYVAWDTSANAGKTGDAANHTIRAVGDGTEFTPAASPAEVDSTNLKGVYKVSLAAGENAYDFVMLGGKSSTANISIMPISWSNTVSATVVAYPGNTPQTGDNFARIGANGAALTALGDARLANLDATVSSRLPTTAYVLPPPDYGPPPTAAAVAAAVLTTQMNEDYGTDGTAPDLTQAIFVIMQRLTDFGIVGSSINVKKLDGTTTAYILTLDKAPATTGPLTSTRSS